MEQEPLGESVEGWFCVFREAGVGGPDGISGAQTAHLGCRSWLTVDLVLSLTGAAAWALLVMCPLTQE